MTWNAGNPPGSGKIRDGDDQIRANNDALEDALSREHQFPGAMGNTAGIHQFTPVSAEPTGYEGRLAIVNDILAWYSNGAWHRAFPSGTKMVFYQSSAPLGWTQDTTINDAMVRIVDSSAGIESGSWTLSGVTVDGHALSVDEMPEHDHTVTYGIGGYGSGGNTCTNITGTANSKLTSQTGGGEEHTHDLTSDGTWRPASIDCLVATKD